jgi:hypothetical protein
VDIMTISFDQWIEIGLRSGWVSPPICESHDGPALTISEEAEFFDGSDPCVFFMRVYHSDEHRQAVEENCPAAVWRNPFREDN